jgi:hypothetical protein
MPTFSVSSLSRGITLEVDALVIAAVNVNGLASKKSVLLDSTAGV